MTAIEVFLIIASMIGGLALFLSGMSTMSDSLSSMAGGALNRLISKVTKNKFLAFLFGAGLTAVVQSASATTVLTVGLVNSGLIQFTNAIGLIIGANLGTTATAWVLSLNALGGASFILTLIKPSSFSPFLAIIGVFMMMLCRAQSKKNIGSVLLGFGTMMIGMNLMSEAIAPLKEMPAVQNLLVSFSNPVLGFLVACAFAMIIQSSDAVIGIVQAFALSIGVTFGAAIPLICGAQVGTCVTSLISSLGGSNNGKRTALMNLYYNLLKTIPFMIIFYLLNSFLHFSFLEKDVGVIGIPLVHTSVNLCGCAVWLPLSGVIVRLAQRTVRQSEKEKEEEANTLTMLDERLLTTPAIALKQADSAVILLSKTVGDALFATSALKDDPGLLDTALLLCERSKKYQEQIRAYLLEIASRELGRQDKAVISLLSAGNTAFGSMSRVAERLLEIRQDFADSMKNLTDQERWEIDVLVGATSEVTQLTFWGYTVRKTNLSLTIRYYTEEFMSLSNTLKSRFIQRNHESERGRINSIIYTDFCYTQEQLIDCCDMVGEALIRYGKECGENNQIESEGHVPTREQIHKIFQDKYEALDLPSE